jgi:hypothetical protein
LEPLLLVFGDGWSRAVAGRMPRAPKEIKQLRDAFEPRVEPRTAAADADEKTRAVVSVLIDALAEATEHQRPSDTVGATVLVGPENTRFAVRAIWLAAFSAQKQTAATQGTKKSAAAALNTQKQTTAGLGAVLRRALIEPCFADVAAIREACEAALVELGTDAAAQALAAVAEAVPNLGDRERLLIASARAGRTLPSQIAESQVGKHGLDENGMRVFAVDRGEYKREYLITLHPDGRVGVTDLDPGAPADEPAEHAAAQEAEQIRGAYENEVRRIEALLAVDREWDREYWQKLYWDNAITRSVSSRLVWAFHYVDHDDSEYLLKPNGVIRSSNGYSGDYGNNSRPSEPKVRLWHPVVADKARVERWRKLLSELGLEQPFPQITRDHAHPAPERKHRELTALGSRPLSRSAFEALLDRHHWRRSEEGGGFVAQRDFPDDRLSVALACTATAGSTNDVMARQPAWFHWTADEARTPLPISEVPPRVYSEAAYDLAAFAKAKAARNVDEKPRSAAEAKPAAATTTTTAVATQEADVVEPPVAPQPRRRRLFGRRGD